VPSVRHGGSRLRSAALVAASGATASAVVLASVAGLSGTAEAATSSSRSHAYTRSPAASAAAIAHEGAVTAAGSADPNAVVSAVVELTPPAGADRAIAKLAAAASGLTRTQRLTTLAKLAPAVSTGDAVTAWARARGLTATATGQWAVSVSGSAAAMSTAFRSKLVAAPSRFDATGPAKYLRPQTAPTVPAALTAVARAVVGLDTRPVFQPRAKAAAVLGDFGFTGPQLRDAYGVPRDPAAGAGITVGTIQFSGFDSQDFLDYADQANIPLFNGQLTAVSVDGANPAAIDAHNGDVEVDLDTQAILSVAPMAKQRVYFAPNTTSGEIDAYAQMAADAQHGLIQVVSSSWGHCESDLDTGFGGLGEATIVQEQIQALVIAGATMSASSGDGGSDDCGNGTTNVDFPASIPEVVAVGGTSLTTGYQKAWSGAGGGTSTVFSKPAYQSGVAGSGRLVPDVAMDADPNTGFALTHQGSFGTVGGTSLAAPLFAGLLAGLLSESDHPAGVGDIHAQLYGASDAAFQDVVLGNNGFAAGPGYDKVTGLGAPRFGALADALGLTAVARTTYHPIDPTRIADSRTGVGVAKARVGAGQSVTITVPGSAPGVPANGVTAAVVNVTAVNPTVSTYLSVYPTGSAGATSSSSVNVAGSTPVPNLVTVKTDASGRFSIYNHSGTVDVVADLAGYYARDAGDLYTPVTPARVLDTRNGTGLPAAKVPAGGSITLKVEGAGGVPGSGVDAVTLNVTAVNASAATHVAVFPAGFGGGPSSSNLNVPPARAVANLVISKVSSSGEVTFSNAFGNVDLIADVQGYYRTTSGLAYSPVPPVRVLDTRPGGLTTDSSGPFLVAAAGSRAGAVVLNLTGVSPSSATFLTLFPTTVPVATGSKTSALNLAAHEIRANLTTTAIAASDPLKLIVYNHLGNIGIVADVSGYFSGQPVSLPQTSVTLTAPGSAPAGTGVTFAASASAPGGSVATLAPGSVVMFVDAGSKILATSAIAANGSASLTTASLSVGTHVVYAVVAGHDGIIGSTSAPVTVTVT
jgi:Bacterial Ig-like domain (group 3)/Pro-kumamolisin, activation domain